MIQPTSVDLKIYYSGSHYVSGMCSRWDISDYNIVIETWLKKGPLLDLQEHIRPGSIKEFKRIVDTPLNYDSTWKGYNTLKLRPVPYTSLFKMRGYEKIMYPKSITSTPIRGKSGWINCKIEGAVSGGTI